MIDEIDHAHDWVNGQTYSHGGTELHSTDTCQVCGLRRRWESDQQNGVDSHYSFSDTETGQDLTLRQALQRGCDSLISSPTTKP